MDCLTINREELAEQYLQGRLDSARQEEFETHLLECAKCVEELELLQALRRDLAERAHEIRGWTAAKPFFRWRTAVLAMGLLLALAVGIGIRQLRDTKKGNNSAESAATTQKDEPKPLVAEVPKNDVAPKSPNSPTPLKAPTIHTAKKGAANATPHQTPSETQAIADATTPASPKHEMQAQSLPAAEVPSGPVDSLPTPQNTNPVNNQGGTQPTQVLTTAQGVELARIGMVEAPPYTFSGAVLHLMLPKNDKRGGFAKGNGSQGEGRVLFQKGMNEYVHGNYSEAAGYLEKSILLEPAAADINFYLGICKLLQGHPEESIVPLENAAAAGQSIYLQPSHYYLAKAYVQASKLANAEEELRKAIAVPGRLTSDAKGLLARLQTLRQQIEKP